MQARFGLSLCILTVCALDTALGLSRYKKSRHVASNGTTKGIRCYNCLSHDHPGCWDPAHPDNANLTIPTVNCYVPRKKFYCIIIIAESAQLTTSGKDIGPVIARTCVSAKKFAKSMIPYSTCKRISKELSISEKFSGVIVHSPKCQLCVSDLCSDTEVTDLNILDEVSS